MQKQTMQSLGALVRSPENMLSARQNSPEAVAFATAMAAQLFGSYPAAKANDPDTYIAAVTRLFLDYPAEVVGRVVRELPEQRGESGWDGIPSKARIKEALETIAGHYRRIDEREARIQRQLAEREEAEEAAKSKPTREEFVAKHPDVARRLGWIEALPPVDEPRPWEQMGVSKEVWDAIPGRSESAA